MRKIHKNAVSVMLLTIGFAALTMLVRPTTLLGRVVEDFGGIPEHLGEWVGHDLNATQHEKLLPNSSLLFRDYLNGYGRIANLSIVYGLDIADIHNPEYCFEGHGWAPLDKRTIRMVSPSGGSYSAKMLLLREINGGLTVCMYYYAGHDVFRDTLAKQRLEVWKQAVLTRNVRPSALVRILVPVVETVAIAEQEAISLAWNLDKPLRQMVSQEPEITRAGRRIGE